jgi:hypothetical protein
VGQGCREVKRDGTAGLAGCVDQDGRRRRHHPAGELGCLPRSRLTVAAAAVFAGRSCLTGLDISFDRLERVFSLGENLVWDVASERVTVARRG